MSSDNLQTIELLRQLMTEHSQATQQELKERYLATVKATPTLVETLLHAMFAKDWARLHRPPPMSRASREAERASHQAKVKAVVEEFKAKTVAEYLAANKPQTIKLQLIPVPQEERTIMLNVKPWPPSED